MIIVYCVFEPQLRAEENNWLAYAYASSNALTFEQKSCIIDSMSVWCLIPSCIVLIVAIVTPFCPLLKKELILLFSEIIIVINI